MIPRVFVAALLLLATMAGPLQAASQTFSLKIDGATALADLVVPETGSLADGVVLITHGTLAHKDMELVEALQDALAERGVASLAHTLTLGVEAREGMYDCTMPHTHKHEDALGEIGAWLDWLKSRGAGPVTLLGHSRGGNQAAWFAAERAPAQVVKLVLMAPATRGPDGAAAASYRQRFGADLSGTLGKAEALVKAGKGDTMMALPGFVYCPDAKARADSVLSYYGAEPRRDTPGLLAKIKVPVLVIAGSKDTVVPDVVERVKPLADGERVRLEVVNGAGHMFLDFFAEDAADQIAAFVKAGS